MGAESALGGRLHNRRRGHLGRRAGDVEGCQSVYGQNLVWERATVGAPQM